MVIERTIKINVPDWAFWQALILTGLDEERGGHYECDWTANGRINWISENGLGCFYGKILQISKMRYLSFIKYDNRPNQQVISLITYNMLAYNGDLVVKFTSDFLKANMTQGQNTEADWLEIHLLKLANIAKKIQLVSETKQYHA